MGDIIAIGDVTEDVFVQVDDVHLICNHGNTDCLLCLKYSDKIAAKRVDKLIGGNAGNVAIGSRRLGLKSALYAQVGNDDQGKRILKSLKDDKVATNYFTLAKNEKTNYSVVINYGAERTILVHHEKRKYKKKSIGPFNWIYLTSMGEGSEIFYPLAQNHLKKYLSKLVFNPGTHQLKSGLKTLGPLIKKSEMVTVNVEEAQFLLGIKHRDIRILLKELRAYGCKIALITDGPEGSYVFDGKKFLYCPIYDVPILERTGCGDSYATAFTAALQYGKSAEDAMKWGTINAASVIQRIGPQEGLIKYSFLQQILKANPKFEVREFDVPQVTKDTKYKPKKYLKW